MMKKNKIAFIISAIVILALIGGSVAYYTTSKVAKSKISASNLKIELVMEGDPGKINPGETKNRTAKVKNAGKETSWIRVEANLVIDGKEEVAANNPYMLFKDLNATDWEWKDGYFYYKQPLESGKTTSELFTGVTLKENLENELNGKSINLKVNAQGTQKKHNGSKATEAKGWPQD